MHSLFGKTGVNGHHESHDLRKTLCPDAGVKPEVPNARFQMHRFQIC